MLTGTIESGMAQRKLHDIGTRPNSRGQGSHTDIIELPPGALRGPQAFVVEQSEDSLIGTHFHSVSQFQIIIKGTGSVGRHEVGPLSIHYAQAYTGYGPVHGGPEGLAYVVLRANGDPNHAFFLPDKLSEMKDAPRLNLYGHPGPARVAADGSSTSVVIEQTDGGAGAWLVRVPANGRTRITQRGHGAGQFRVVLEGQMHIGETTLERLGCVFLNGAERDTEVVAGPQGLQLVVVEFAKEMN